MSPGCESGQRHVVVGVMAFDDLVESGEVVSPHFQNVAVHDDGKHRIGHLHQLDGEANHFLDFAICQRLLEVIAAEAWAVRMLCGHVVERAKVRVYIVGERAIHLLCGIFAFQIGRGNRQNDGITICAFQTMEKSDRREAN